MIGCHLRPPLSSLGQPYEDLITGYTHTQASVHAHACTYVHTCTRTRTRTRTRTLRRQEREPYEATHGALDCARNRTYGGLYSGGRPYLWIAHGCRGIFRCEGSVPRYNPNATTALQPYTPALAYARTHPASPRVRPAAVRILPATFT